MAANGKKVPGHGGDQPCEYLRKQWPFFSLVLCIALLTGPVSCAVAPGGKTASFCPESTAYIPPSSSGDALSRHAPVFIVERSGYAFNRIGTPTAEPVGEGRERIYVDPALATVYVRRQHFSTCRDHYTNLIYRIHFQEVPCGVIPSHITCGKNPGLLIYVTLNSEGGPVLVTTLHTCGCYLAFIPTDRLRESCYPEGWDMENQQVYGERLPGRVVFPRDPGKDGERLIIRLRSETHRVKGITVGSPGDIQDDVTMATYRRLPAATLRNLRLGRGRTSFFEESGPARGYVKGSGKPYERLLMSWWTFDWRIGEDKRLGPPEETGVVFYTSLKFWDREESNIWYFDRFLEYWGWGL